MAQHFDVYPQDIATGKPKQPVTLAQHGTVGDTMPFTQFIEHVGTLAQSGGAAGNMFIRIVMLDLPGNPAGGLPPAPTVVLRVNNGTPSPLNDATHPAGQYYPVSDATGDIGDAIIITNTNPYIVGINVHRPGATWNIQIVNNDNVPHAFTWVVADSDDAVDANNNHIGAKQPWLHITPGSLSYTALTNQLISPDLFPTNQPFLTAFNYGTAPLTIQNVSPGSNFSIVAPVPTIAPNASTKISIQFQSPTVGSFSVPAYQFQSNDTTALADPTTQHNS